MVELLERMEIMFQQEQDAYLTVDYLAPEFQAKLASASDVKMLERDSAKTLEETSLSSSSTGINDIWREKICEWSYQVIDHFDFSREVVSISIHYLDRFLASRHCNKKVFQLAAMTSLFLAIKLYEPGKLSMVSMIELSRGYFQVEQMVAMEMEILRYVHDGNFITLMVLTLLRHPKVPFSCYPFARTRLHIVRYWVFG